MESSMINHYEEQSMGAMPMIYSSSSTTDQEVDQLPAAAQEHSFGMGRSYECVFCRRGFNTAQALGGHMNIHRKDRARNNNNNNNNNKSNDHEVESLRLRSFTTYYNYKNCNFLESSSSSCNGVAIVPLFHGNHHHSRPFGEDAGRRGLGLGLGRMRLSPLMGSSGHADQEMSMTRRRGGIQQEELDLELRL